MVSVPGGWRANHGKRGLVSRYGSCLVAAAVFVSGCAADKSILGPNHPLTTTSTAPLREDLVHREDIANWKKAYDDETDDKKRMDDRNRIVRQLMLVTDQYYLAWSQQLYGARAIGGTAADIATGVLSAFSAASGASAAKSLALVVSAISSTRLAVEKNLLLEKTAGALIAQMDTDRANVSVQIGQYLRQSTTDYPLEEALRDIMRYYKAGTLAAAGESLQAAAIQSRDATQAAVERTKGDDIVAPAVLEKAAVTPAAIDVAPLVGTRPNVMPDRALRVPVRAAPRVRPRPNVKPERALQTGNFGKEAGIRKRLLSQWVLTKAANGDAPALRDCANKLGISPLPPDTALADAIRTRIAQANAKDQLAALETATGLPGEPGTSGHDPENPGPDEIKVGKRPDVSPDH